MSLPALVLVWVFGMGLVGMSDDAIEMSETWVVLSLIGWVVLMVVSWFLIRPGADRHVAGGEGPPVGRHRDHPPAAGRDPHPDDLEAGLEPDLIRPDPIGQPVRTAWISATGRSRTAESVRRPPRSPAWPLEADHVTCHSMATWSGNVAPLAAVDEELR